MFYFFCSAAAIFTRVINPDVKAVLNQDRDLPVTAAAKVKVGKARAQAETRVIRAIKAIKVTRAAWAGVVQDKV